MKETFWQQLKKPIFCQAPMANITDHAFRQTIEHFGPSDVFWTEMVSVEALCSKGRKSQEEILKYSKNQHPIVAQLFGADADKFYQAARVVKKLGFDGVDINMGCPDKNVIKQGAGAALIENKNLVSKIIKAVQKGAPGLAISVKTRLGYSKIDYSWLKFLLKQNLDALIIHGRTKAQGFKGQADWQVIGEITKLSKKVLIIGNGDIKSRQEGLEKARRFGLSGVMVGRALLGKAGFFAGEEVDKIEALKYHLSKIKKEDLNDFKKHLAAYCSGFSGAKKLRIELMAAKSKSEVLKKLV